MTLTTELAEARADLADYDSDLQITEAMLAEAWNSPVWSSKAAQQHERDRLAEHWAKKLADWCDALARVRAMEGMG